MGTDQEQLGAGRQTVLHPPGAGLADHDAATAGGGPQARRPVDGLAEVVPVALDRLAGVHGHAHTQLDRIGPRLGEESPLCVEGSSSSSGGVLEDAEGAVALAPALEDDTTAVLDGVGDDAVVAWQRQDHRIGGLLPQRRGPHDVRQQEGHFPGGQHRHALSTPGHALGWTATC